MTPEQMEPLASPRTRCLHDVPVPGGMLRTAVWEASDDAPTALLVHGVTSSHLAWSFVAERMPDVRLIAPDLRGRGRSNEVTGPAGMKAHADDLARVLDAFDVDRAVVVGHSMGAFVSVVLAHRHPERVRSLLLVDGGMPLDVPAGLDTDSLISHILGPTAERLSMRFATERDYLDFWRDHPAFRDAWSPMLDEYFTYDLHADTTGLRPATTYETTADDTVDMNAGASLPDALAALTHPTRLLTVPRGLRDEPPGLYAADHLQRVLAAYPGVQHERIAELNHYTIVMSDAGADAIVPHIRAALA